MIMIFAGYLDLKGEKNRPKKHDTLRAFVCLMDYMYLLDENTTVNGTVTVLDADNYTLKLEKYISLEERRDFTQTWQVYEFTHGSNLFVVTLCNAMMIQTRQYIMAQ